MLCIEVSVADIRSATILTYGQNCGFSRRIYLLYDGIHYDAIVEKSDVTGEIRVFGTGDERDTFTRVLNMLAELKKKRQFIDVSSGRLCCNACHQTFVGDKEAIDHARQTGHQDFGLSE